MHNTCYTRVQNIITMYFAFRLAFSLASPSRVGTLDSLKKLVPSILFLNNLTQL